MCCVFVRRKLQGREVGTVLYRHPVTYNERLIWTSLRSVATPSGVGPCFSRLLSPLEAIMTTTKNAVVATKMKKLFRDIPRKFRVREAQRGGLIIQRPT